MKEPKLECNGSLRVLNKDCDGYIVPKERHSDGKIFYGCTRWPLCENVMSEKEYCMEVSGDYDTYGEDWYMDPWMFFDD